MVFSVPAESWLQDMSRFLQQRHAVQLLCACVQCALSRPCTFSTPLHYCTRKHTARKNHRDAMHHHYAARSTSLLEHHAAMVITPSSADSALMRTAPVVQQTPRKHFCTLQFYHFSLAPLACVSLAHRGEARRYGSLQYTLRKHAQRDEHVEPHERPCNQADFALYTDDRANTTMR